MALVIECRAFDRAAASHYSRQPASQAQFAAGQTDQPAHLPCAGSGEGDEYGPVAAPLQRAPYVHHGYSEAKENLLQQRAGELKIVDWLLEAKNQSSGWFGCANGADTHLAVVST